MESLQILSRSEMRMIKGGSVCTCSYGDCRASLHQYSGSWTLNVVCEGSDQETYTGSGAYGGTVCGGSCPNQLEPPVV